MSFNQKLYVLFKIYMCMDAVTRQWYKGHLPELERDV